MLTESRRMRPAGLTTVRAANRDGRWESTYPSPTTIDVPEDFAAKLGENPAAKAVFEGLNKMKRYAVLLPVHMALSQCRNKRIEGLLKGLAGVWSPGARRER
jgi:uncharacterized protein YdeI (YjbR/CyaY-like superfamily)